MQDQFDEVRFAQAVQLAAGYMASGAWNSAPGDDMREAVKVAYQALFEARADLLEELMPAPATGGA